jgi:DUF971 family protein
MAEVAAVEVDRAHGVTVTFADGVVCSFTLQELRPRCPCASCRGWRERGEPAWPRPGDSPSLAVTHAELVGAWGLSLTWSDGHAAGIFPWDALRAWCEERATDGEPPAGVGSADG